MTLKRLRLIVLAFASLALSACSSYDCNSDDVHKTLLELIAGNTTGTENQVDGIFGGGTTTTSQELFAKGTFAGVVTLDRNDETGHFLCKAKISVEAPERVVTKEVTYEVKKVESDDAEFEVSAENSDINSLRWAVNGQVNRAAQLKRKQEEAEAAKVAWAAAPAIAMSDAEAIEGIKTRLRQEVARLDENQLTVVPVDINSDGYKEYVAIWNNSPPPGEDWRLMQFFQRPEQPGQKASLGPHHLDGPFFQRSFKHYEINGSKLTVSDGTGWAHTLDLVYAHMNPMQPNDAPPAAAAHAAGPLTPFASGDENQAAASDTAGCEDGWLQAHRAEVGEEAPVSMEQLGEWEQWCKEGKSPPAA